MNDTLSKYEKQLGKLRTKWSKAAWRKVAYQLAGIVIPETRGRKTLTEEEKYEKEQRLRAAEFWRDQHIATKSKFDGDVGTVQMRHIPIKNKPAIKVVLEQSPSISKEQLTEAKLKKMTKALNREIQISQKNRREEK